MGLDQRRQAKRSKLSQPVSQPEPSDTGESKFQWGIDAVNELVMKQALAECRRARRNEQ